jgi:hypothetical protein
MRHQCGHGSHARSCAGGLAAGVASSNNNDVERFRPRDHAGFYRGARKPGRNKFAARMFHVKHPHGARARMGEGTMFHVKRFHVKRFVRVNKTILLTYTKIPEDHVEEVFHIDPAEQVAQ